MVPAILLAVMMVFVGTVENRPQGELRDRIMGGELAELHEFPGIVSLISTNNLLFVHFCGGSILNELWGLTASHCVGVFPGRTIARAGSNYNQNGGSEHEVLYFIKHEHYVEGINDIALFKVLEPFVFDTPNIQPVKLATSDLKIPENTEVTVAGWGIKDLMRQASPDLKKIILKTKIGSFCRSDEVCAVAEEPFSGVCLGDSGGPMFLDGEMVGIAESVTPDCDLPWYSNTYTSVAFHRSWIDSILNNTV